MGDAVGKDSGFAAARSGDHEQRAVAVLDGASLLGIQPVIHLAHVRPSLIDFATAGKVQNAKGAAIGPRSPSSLNGTENRR
jgi:hypothetical protein